MAGRVGLLKKMRRNRKLLEARVKKDNVKGDDIEEIN